MPKTYKKYRKRIPFWGRVLIVFGLAALAFGILVLVAYSSGMRYVICNRTDGRIVKFLGFVDKSNYPINGKIIFADGSTAEVRKGTGLIEYSDGSVYEGKLSVCYERTGEGKYLLSSGEKYEGNFDSDMMNGKGTYHFINGDVYEGDLVNNKMEGQGVYTYANGDKYVGSFKNGLRDGEGEMTCTDGSYYKGTYSEGLRNGFGLCNIAVYDASTGLTKIDRYEGYFVRDMRQGKGSYTWANGENYTGDFYLNNMNGEGTYTWVDGRASYTGYFVNGEIVLVDPETQE